MYHVVTYSMIQNNLRSNTFLLGQTINDHLKCNYMDINMDTRVLELRKISTAF